MTDKQKQIVIDYQTTFASAHGRRVLDNLEEWSGFNDRITPTSIDAIAAALVDLGRRDMFLHVKDKLDARLDEERQETAESEAEDVD